MDRSVDCFIRRNERCGVLCVCGGVLLMGKAERGGSVLDGAEKAV